MINKTEKGPKSPPIETWVSKVKPTHSAQTKSNPLLVSLCPTS